MRLFTAISLRLMPTVGWERLPAAQTVSLNSSMHKETPAVVDTGVSNVNGRPA